MPSSIPSVTASSAITSPTKDSPEENLTNQLITSIVLPILASLVGFIFLPFNAGIALSIGVTLGAIFFYTSTTIPAHSPKGSEGEFTEQSSDFHRATRIPQVVMNNKPEHPLSQENYYQMLKANLDNSLTLKANNENQLSYLKWILEVIKYSDIPHTVIQAPGEVVMHKNISIQCHPELLNFIEMATGVEL